MMPKQETRQQAVTIVHVAETARPAPSRQEVHGPERQLSSEKWGHVRLQGSGLDNWMDVMPFAEMSSVRDRVSGTVWDMLRLCLQDVW